MQTPLTTKNPKTSVSNQDFHSPHANKQKLSNSQIARFWVIWGGMVILGYRFYQTIDLIYLIIAALIIALSSEGLILSFEKKVKKRSLAIGISYILLFLFLFSGVIFIVPFLVAQISNFISWTSKTIIEMRDFFTTNSWTSTIESMTRLPNFAQDLLIKHRNILPRNDSEFQSILLSGLNNLLQTSSTYFKQFSLSIVWAIGGIFSVTTNIIIVFTLAVFFSIEKDYLISLFLKFWDHNNKEKNREKIDNIYQKLSLWLKARIYLSLFVIIAMYVAFWIMGLFGLEIPNKFSLSLITGLLDIVPYIGPIFSIIPILILAAISNGFRGMIIAGLVFFTIQRIQNNIITPVLMEKQLWVNPILILISALLGAKIMGFMGIILSVPLAVILGLFIWENNKLTTDLSSQTKEKKEKNLTP